MLGNQDSIVSVFILDIFLRGNTFQYLIRRYLYVRAQNNSCGQYKILRSVNGKTRNSFRVSDERLDNRNNNNGTKCQVQEVCSLLDLAARTKSMENILRNRSCID